MHAPQDMPHCAGLIQNFQESFVHMQIFPELPVYHPRLVTNALRKIGMQPHAMALHEQKNTHEFPRLIAKNTAVHIVDLAIGYPEAINDLLLAATHPAPDRLLPCRTRHQCQSAFNRTHNKIDIARVAIVIAHECFQPPCWRTIRVAKPPGNLGLHRFGEHLRRSIQLIM